MKNLLSCLVILIAFNVTSQAHGQLQALIDATPAGGVVTLPAGETFTGSITISQPMTINGNGSTLDASGEYFGISIASNVNGVTIEGFTIIGDVSTTIGITVNPGASNVTILNNDISGMAMPNSNGSPLSYGILCWGNSDPINLPMNILIEGNDIHGVSGTAILLDNTEGVTIHNNQLRDITPVLVSGSPWASGIQASTANGLVISGNTMSNLITASSLLNCTNVSLDSNQYVGTTACMLLATVPNDIDVDAEDWWSVENAAMPELFVPALIQYFNSAEAQALTAELMAALPITLSSSHPGCMDSEACNYDEDAISDDGTCGDGIADGDCDCDGNQLDALDVCGGDCLEDSDADGVCDTEDNCKDLEACNYLSNCNAVCLYTDSIGICGGDCILDANQDGICDEDGVNQLNDLDDDGCIGATDILIILSQFGECSPQQ